MLLLKSLSGMSLLSAGRPPNHHLIIIISHVIDSSVCKSALLGGVFAIPGWEDLSSQHCAPHLLGKTNIYYWENGAVEGCGRVGRKKGD